MADPSLEGSQSTDVHTASRTGPQVDVTRAGVWEWDLSAHQWIWDAQTYALFGLDPKERGSLYERWRRCIAPEDEVRVLRELSDALSGQKDLSCRFHIFRLDEVREISCVGRILRHSRGDLLVGFVHDVTGSPSDVDQDVLAGAQWEQSRLAAHYARDAVVITDGHARIEWVNPSFERLTGFTLKEGYGRTPGELLVGEETSAETRARILTAIANGSPTREEILYYKKDGTAFWGELNLQNVVNPNGGGTRTVGILRDITERRTMREAMVRQNALLEEVTRVSKIGPWEFDPKSQTFTWVPETFALMGWDHHEAPTLDQFVNLFEDEGREDLRSLFLESQSGRAIETIQFMTAGPETNKWMAIRGRWQNTESENPVLVGSLQCVTEQRESEELLRRQEREAREKLEDLRKAKAAADAATKARNRFAAIVSHELRTPLNGILGALQVIRNTHDKARLDNLVDLAETADHQLNRLIGQILDYAEIDDEGLFLSPKPTDLAILLKTVWEREQSRDDDPDRFQINLENLEDAWIKIDPDRIVQMVSALLSNARKHAPTGPILLSAAITSRKEQRLHVRLEISDAGPGIPLDQREEVLKPFVQLKTELGTHTDGPGLGLAMAQKIVEAYDGSIGVSDSPFGGVTFWADVRFDICEEVSPNNSAIATSRRRASAELTDRRVLVVDDNALNLIVLRELLESSGATVVTVSSGAEAIETCHTHIFEAVLMDIRMPGMSGYEAAEAIHTECEKNASVPIFALTADAQAGVRKSARDAGMRDVLLKPIARDTLVDAILELPFRPMEKAAS